MKAKPDVSEVSSFSESNSAFACPRSQSSVRASGFSWAAAPPSSLSSASPNSVNCVNTGFSAPAAGNTYTSVPFFSSEKQRESPTKRPSSASACRPIFPAFFARANTSAASPRLSTRANVRGLSSFTGTSFSLSWKRAAITFSSRSFNISYASGVYSSGMAQESHSSFTGAFTSIVASVLESCAMS